MRPMQNQSHSTWEEEGLRTAVNDWWLLKEGESVFFKGVAPVGSNYAPMVGGASPKPWGYMGGATHTLPGIYGKFKRNSVSYFFRDSDLGEGWTWEK